jgi:hypothetical protein
MQPISTVLDHSKYPENISLILQKNCSPLDPHPNPTSNQIKSSTLKQDLFTQTLQHHDLLNISSLVDPNHNQNVKKTGIDPKIHSKSPKNQFLQQIGLNKSIYRERQQIMVEKSQRPRLIGTQRLNDFGNDDLNDEYDEYDEFFKRGKETGGGGGGLGVEIEEGKESGYERY